MAWDKNKPAGSQKLRLSDDEIRENNDCLEDALSRDLIFPGTKGTDAGRHNKVTLKEQGADPAAVADHGIIYTKDVGGKSEPYFRYGAGGITHLLIPPGTKMVFYQDTAPVGWTIVTTVDDQTLIFTKGKAAGGTPGGEAQLGHFNFDGGSNADQLQENDTVRLVGGGSWSVNLRSISYSGSAPTQTGTIYYDTLAGGTPADDDAIEDNNGRLFTADVNGINYAAGTWTITGLTIDSHNHSISNKPLAIGSSIANRALSTANICVTSEGGKMRYSQEADSSTIYDVYAKIKTGEVTASVSPNFSHNGNWRPAAHAVIICTKD